MKDSGHEESKEEFLAWAKSDPGFTAFAQAALTNQQWIWLSEYIRREGRHGSIAEIARIHNKPAQQCGKSIGQAIEKLLKKKDKRDSAARLCRQLESQGSQVTLRDLRMHYEISERLSNCLHSAGVERVADLAHFTEKDLLAIKNIGKRTMREAEAVMKRYGVQWSPTSAPPEIQRMTWGEFKKVVEATGVNNKTPIRYIDVRTTRPDSLDIRVTDDGGLGVKN